MATVGSKLFRWTATLLAALSIPVAAQAPVQIKPSLTSKPLSSAAGVAPTLPSSGTGTPALTKSDVDAWLDGFMPYALKAGGIPGAEVVVVKDGQILTARGFGYSDVNAGKPVDPALTLFRPGSVSKLFTWTAVMQQVQAGKLNLDADVNQYLDFKIPPFEGKPVTLRNLMTHTGGFAETAKYLIMFGERKPDPLGKLLARWVPDRIYAPGSMPAYSNYGASVAGYIVERVSGEPFNAYVARHIFAPLQMTHSSFDQPLPPQLAPLMSKAYAPGSTDPKPYEVIGLAPAGALASTGTDMGKFMIAHLSNGGPLLNPATAQLMHSNINRPFSALPAMALGFYHEDRNGLNIVGHGGDTVFFHSDLHLFLDKGVGLYMSLNSVGKDTAAHPLREQLFETFTDRYFPAPRTALPTLSSGKDHGQQLAGHYVSSRAGAFNFLRLTALLGQTTVGVDKNGLLTASSLTDPSGTPRKWREVKPYLWQEVNGSDYLQASLDANGQVKMFSITPFAPIFEFLPAPASLNAGWILPVAGAALLIMLITALGWPVVALVRRRYRQAPAISGQALRLHRGTRVTAWLLLAVAVGWTVMFTILNNDLSVLDDRLDIWMRLLQLLLIVAIFGTAVAVWNAITVAREAGRRWPAKLWAIVVALAAAFLVWLCLDVGLLTASLNY